MTPERLEEIREVVCDRRFVNRRPTESAVMSELLDEVERLTQENKRLQPFQSRSVNFGGTPSMVACNGCGKSVPTVQKMNTSGKGEKQQLFYLNDNAGANWNTPAKMSPYCRECAAKRGVREYHFVDAGPLRV